MYVAATPFWYVSLQRAKRALQTGTIPLISLFAAFCFVVMMFNLPLPGGTTGHALGVGVAAIVLGPWNSIIAISVALFIQAVFFGDGGLTSLGANCFNMAVVGSLVAYFFYRAVSGRSSADSRRRVIAAAIGGYAAINVSAFLTAVEFGIQPIFFHDATGAPLYAPYPLGIAIPAMMLGHLTLAGAAEAVLAAGLVAFIQRTNPDLLAFQTRERLQEAGTRSWRHARQLWVTLAFLLVLTPLGVLAVGTAWGEWSAGDFSDAAARQQIASASRNVAPPQIAPSGLQRLSSIWTAPFPSYAPGFVRHRGLGYLLSAMFGAGLVIASVVLSARIASRFSRNGV